MPLVFDSLTIRAVTLKNRLVVSPMCQYSSKDGFASDWHLVHLGSRAVGGAGLVITEATAISPEGRISNEDLGIWQDEHIGNLKRITHFIDQQGAVAGIQLAHAGRKASHQAPWKGGKAYTSEKEAWPTLAPSAIAHTAGEPLPTAMDLAAIEKLRQDFVSAAQRSVEAGFKVIELHAAHGYLLHSFLSPLSNQRSDAYGGSFGNRIRLLLEIVSDIRKVIGEDLSLWVRISATDWVAGGWTLEDSIALVKILKDKGVDLIDCSSGGNSPEQKIPVGALYQVNFSEAIKSATGILTGAVGLITRAEEVNQIIQNGQADVVLQARQMLRDPYFPLHAAQEMGIDLPWPSPYERAKRKQV